MDQFDIPAVINSNGQVGEATGTAVCLRSTIEDGASGKDFLSWLKSHQVPNFFLAELSDALIRDGYAPTLKELASGKEIDHRKIYITQRDRFK